MIDDELNEEFDDLANQLDKEEDRETLLSPGICYFPEDMRAIPCSPTDIEAVNRVLNEQYFGRKHYF